MHIAKNRGQVKKSLLGTCAGDRHPHPDLLDGVLHPAVRGDPLRVGDPRVRPALQLADHGVPGKPIQVDDFLCDSF